MRLNSQVNRAELLYALRECKGDIQQWSEMAPLFGYEASENQRQPQITLKHLENEFKINADDPSQKAKYLLNPPFVEEEASYYYLAYRERYTTEERAQREQPDCFEGITGITNDELSDFWESQEPINPDSLAQVSRFAPKIRNNLNQEMARRLDVKTLIKKIAKQIPLKKIPTLSHVLPAGRVFVIADLNQRLVPFWDDIDKACAMIKQIRGKIGLDIRVLAKDEPLQGYCRYEDWQQRKLGSKQCEKIQAQSVVFILSDLGQLAPQNSIIRKRWLSFVRQLNRRGIKPFVLAPIAAEKQLEAFQSTTQLTLWQRFGKLKVQKTRGNIEAHKKDIERVLSFLSLSPHIEPKLLRSFCELLPFHQGNTGVEVGAYLHPHVLFGLTSISIKPDFREHYQQLFKQLPEALKQQVFECIKRHHSNQFAVVWAETIINAERLMTVPSGLSNDAEELMRRFSKRYHSEASHDGMKRFARRHLSRLSLEQQSKEYASVLYGLAYRSEINQGEAIPEQFDTRLVNQVIREPSEVQQYNIRQIGKRCVISLAPSNADEALEQFGQTLGTFSVAQKTIIANQVKMDLPDKKLSFDNGFHIDTGKEYLTVRMMRKPSWANAMMMHNGYPFASLELGGRLYDLELHASEQPRAMGKWKVVGGDSNIGFDETGLFADVSFFSVKQRFRYIEPNTFMMGSPEYEEDRNDDEDFHQVTLTEGYWLADTTCTQELWQAVMGDNPAEFKESKENPVERVSWVDVQRFISELKEHTPKLNIQLPTEAQWENACRAGTITPFSFDGEISPDRVNYSGKWAERDYDKKDKYISKSEQLKRVGQANQNPKATKTYPANLLGLYEMHGNVWEWCLDEWKENLGKDSAIDPVLGQLKPSLSDSKTRTEDTSIESSEILDNIGGIDKARVIRGGSWLSDGSSCRSAQRNGSVPSDSSSDIGFRLLLGLELWGTSDRGKFGKKGSEK